MAGVCKKSLTGNALTVQLLHSDGKGGSMSLTALDDLGLPLKQRQHFLSTLQSSQETVRWKSRTMKCLIKLLV